MHTLPSCFFFFRRTLDWDADPTPFSECVTIVTGDAPFQNANDNGFTNSDPLQSFGASNLVNCLSTAGCPADCSRGNCDTGATDHGVAFEFRFQTSLGTSIELAPGETQEFKIYFGGAPDKATAEAAMNRVGVEAYSLAYSGASGCGATTTGSPATFTLAFSGVGGNIIAF